MSPENAPCGPSTQTGVPGGSAVSVRVKSPAWRTVNDVHSSRALEEMVNGCSSAVGDWAIRSQANWPGTKRHEPSAPRGQSTTVLMVGLSERTSLMTNSVEESRSPRHSQR